MHPTPSRPGTGPSVAAGDTLPGTEHPSSPVSLGLSRQRRLQLHPLTARLSFRAPGPSLTPSRQPLNNNRAHPRKVRGAPGWLAQRLESCVQSLQVWFSLKCWTVSTGKASLNPAGDADEEKLSHGQGRGRVGTRGSVHTRGQWSTSTVATHQARSVGPMCMAGSSWRQEPAPLSVPSLGLALGHWSPPVPSPCPEGPGPQCASPGGAPSPQGVTATLGHQVLPELQPETLLGGARPLPCICLRRQRAVTSQDAGPDRPRQRPCRRPPPPL